MKFKREHDDDDDDDRDDDDEENEKNHFQWVNLTLVIALFFSLLINIMIILIHSKQKSLRKGFFIVIFVQIIMEAIINFSLLIMNIIYLTETERDKWFVVFPLLFNFCYVSNILYNIRIMVYLMTLDKKKDEEVNYDLKDDNIDNENDSLSRHSTISLISHSFNSFHFFAIILSIIHTVLYGYFLFEDDNDIEEHGWRWFFYFMSGSDGILRLCFYSFNFIFFIISLPYLILSLNKEKLSDHILLKRFSIYCLFSSIISLLFPTAVIIHEYDILKDNDEIFYSLMFVFIFYILITWVFRVNCYYIQYILEQKGKGFCQKCSAGFRILFCCESIPSPNFIDLNSSFVYHSLANLNDFIQELSTDVGKNENNAEKHEFNE